MNLQASFNCEVNENDANDKGEKKGNVVWAKHPTRVFAHSDCLILKFLSNHTCVECSTPSLYGGLNVCSSFDENRVVD